MVSSGMDHRRGGGCRQPRADNDAGMECGFNVLACVPTPDGIPRAGP